MELRQLEYFVAVAEEASFTRAAERVHISQSGVSAQIRRLEAELGAELIDRAGRTATLTTAGAAALEHARAALAAAGAVRQAVDDVNGLLRGRLVVGMVTGCTVTPLFDALAAFKQAHPGVELAVHEDASARLTEQVRHGEADLALVGTAGAPPDVEALVISRERLVALVPPDHPLAGARRGVALADVCAHPLVCMPRGTGIRTVLDRACAVAGVRAEIALEASAPGAILDLAARGLGVAVLSESMAGDGAALRPLAIEDADALAELALVWTPAPGPALRALLERCRAAFAPRDALAAR